MVKHLQAQAESLYGFPQPTPNQFPVPISARRDPATSDTGYMIGQVWVNRVAGTFFGLASNAGGVATWLSLGGNANSAFATVTAAGNITSTAGNILASAGNITTTLGNIVATQGNITATLGNIVATQGNITATLGDITATNGNIIMGTAGKGLRIKIGANARMGTSAAMVAGTIAIANTSVTANTVVFLSPATTGGEQGALSVIINAGVGFTINSNSASDSSTVNWLLIEAI